MTDGRDDEVQDDVEVADLEHVVVLPRIELARLADPQSLRVIGGMAVAFAILIWPDQTDVVLTRLIGVGLTLVSLIGGWGALRARPIRWLGVVLAGGGLATGIAFSTSPDQSIVTVGRAIAVLIALVSSADLVRNFVRPPAERVWRWPAAKAAAGLATASLLAAYPSALLEVVIVVLALGWAVLGILTLLDTVVDSGDRASGMGESLAALVRWLDDRPKTADDRSVLYGKLFYEGPNASSRLIRFVTLMSLASVLASMGVITESSAVVIGAMLVAPLMTPLMGVAISVIMGWPNRLTRHAAVALLGVVLAIGIGLLLGAVVPTTIDVATNGEILSRSSPTTLDLIIAIAAGAAGAYGLSRPDVSDALPGVAIAISLVPPLTVVGIAYSQGAWAEGHGALLLFVTNGLAIVVVGGLTFVVTGVTPARRVAGNQHRVRTASASIVAIAAIVIGALTINGAEIAATSLATSTVEESAREWISASPDHVFVRTRIDGDEVTVVVAGPTTGRPPAEPLQEQLSADLNREITVVVRLVVEQREIVPPAG